MFDNQLLNLNMLPINSNNQANLNKNLPQHGQTTLVDNNNNNNQNNIQNSRRRQLPLPPGMTSKQSDNNNTGKYDNNNDIIHGNSKKNEYQLHIPHFKAFLRLLGLKLRLTFTENQKFFS